MYWTYIRCYKPEKRNIVSPCQHKHSDLITLTSDCLAIQCASFLCVLLCGGNNTINYEVSRTTRSASMVHFMLQFCLVTLTFDS